MKIGRNEKCPCGSGKKFKKCCISDTAILENEFEAFEDSEDTRVAYFGYAKTVGDSIERALGTSQEECLAIVQQLTEGRLEHAGDMGIKGASIGDWAVTTGECEDIEIHAPFKTMEEAFEFGYKNCGISSWRSKPDFRG